MDLKIHFLFSRSPKFKKIFGNNKLSRKLNNTFLPFFQKPFSLPTIFKTILYNKETILSSFITSSPNFSLFQYVKVIVSLCFSFFFLFVRRLRQKIKKDKIEFSFLRSTLLLIFEFIS